MNYEYDIEGYYEGSWETVTCEPTRAEAVEQKKCYQENEPGTAFRIKKVKERDV